MNEYKNHIMSFSKPVKCAHCGNNTQHNFTLLATRNNNDDEMLFHRQGALMRYNDEYGDENIHVYLPLMYDCKAEYFCSQCFICKNICIWLMNDDHSKRELVYPKKIFGEDLSDEIDKNISKPYNQTRTIIYDSPEATCLLLRVCLERICNQLLDKHEGDLYTKINKVAQEYNMQEIDKNIMYIIREIGNVSAHKNLMKLNIKIEDLEAIITFTHFFIKHTIQKKIDMKKLSKKVFKK